MYRDWMRTSSVAKWAQCPRMARQSKEPSGRGAAAVVGTLVHAELAGQEQVDIPNQVWYDNITASLSDAQAQASLIARRIRSLYAAEGIVLDRHEIEVRDEHLRMKGHVDGTGYIADMGSGAPETVALDVKTGWHIGAAWLQLGGYATLLRRMGQPVQWVGVVHAPRNVPARLKAPTWAARKAEDVEAVFLQFMSMVDGLHDADLNDVALPGDHCRYCYVGDCAVRAQERRS